MGNGFNVEPVQEPIKLSDSKKISSFIKNKSIYQSKDVFPQSLIQKIGQYSFRGYEIIVLIIYPIQYVPDTGDIYYYDSITLSIDTIINENINPLFRGLVKDEIEVMNKVDNPLIVDTYKISNYKPISSDTIDLLIITTKELKNGFIPLKNAHDAEGIKTEIITLNDIRLFPELITTEDIRNYIRDKFRNNNLEYVLIGGDYDVIPTKDLWVQSWNGGSQTTMPSDLYYSCLDGSFNSDDDEKWGEPKDGPKGEDVDLISEIYIGRACVNDTDETKNFVDKTISYMESGGYHNGQVLMVGEYLWSDPDTWGGDYMDELIDESVNHNYKTTGIPSDVYNIQTLYDRDWMDNDWPKTEIMNNINNNYRIINHLGHSYYGYNMKMVNDDIFDLENDDLCFIYSQGCMAGGFDNPNDYDCIAEYLTVKTDKAAFAVIMNARYGWGVVGSTNGPSQRYHRQFIDAIFGEGITEIGKANQDSKEDNVYKIKSSCMRWCYYQLNLFGDPTLRIFDNENHPPNKPARPTAKMMGGRWIKSEFKTISTDIDGDELYYKWDWGDGTTSDWIGPYESGKEVGYNNSWNKFGIFSVRVKTQDEHRAQSPWSDPIAIIVPKNKSLTNRYPIYLNEIFSNICSIALRLLSFVNR